MPNGMYGGVRGKETKVGLETEVFRPTRLSYSDTLFETVSWKNAFSDQIIMQKFVGYDELSYLCSAILRKAWAISAAGSEHLPYKQRVGGSNPSLPTKVVERD